MSDTDPYAAPTVEEARVVPAKAPEAVTEAPEAVTAAPAVETLVVPEGSVKKVLQWVGEDKDRAAKALEVETSGDNRSSLITKLEAIIN